MDAEREDLKIVSLNVDDNQQTAARYEVLSIPTLILFKDGAEAKRIVGARPNFMKSAPVFRELAWAVRTFALPQGLLHELIRAVGSDLAPARFAAWPDLAQWAAAWVAENYKPEPRKRRKPRSFEGKEGVLRERGGR